MALVFCPECGGQVSTRAIACPHCGYPMRGEKRRGRGLFGTIAQLPCFVVGLVMIFFVVLVILVLLDVYYLPGLIPGLLGIGGPKIPA